MWKAINDYFYNTHAPTHNFKLNLCEIYQVSRNGKSDIFDKKAKELGNVQLLIHGSRLSNWCSILQKGLILDPSKLGVFIAGKMFSLGIYFANSFSKSAQYCGIPWKGSGKVCFALAEVALGKESKRKQADYYISKKSLEKEGCESCWGMGNMTPSSYTTVNDVKIPTGKLKNSNVGSVLRYDEKIVYDTDQFMIKYLVVADMSY